MNKLQLPLETLHPPETAPPQKIYTAQFAQLCLSSLLFAMSFNMIIPELPNYLTSLGGAEFKGLIISLFTLTAGLSRPFSGKLSDTIGRVPVMVVGGVVCFAMGLLYPVLTTVMGFLFLRFFHGFSTGFTPTGINAYIADIIPADRRGEAMGVSSFFFALGIALGPFIGSRIQGATSYDTLFYISAAMAFVSVICIATMKETLPNVQKFGTKHLKISWKDVYEKNVLPPAIVMVFMTISFGTVLTIIPDFSEHIEIVADKKGDFFLYMTLGSVLVRFFAGKASDRWGRIPLLIGGMVLVIGAFSMIAQTTTALDLYIASFIAGLGIGIYSPTLFAWAIDLGSSVSRGKAMSTLFIGMELGIGLGAIISAEIYDNKPENFATAFWFTVISMSIAWLYLWYRLLRFGKNKKKTFAEVLNFDKGLF